MQSPTKMPRDVWVLSLVGLLVAIGFGVLVPVLPVVAREFGVSQFAVGAVVSMFAVTRLLTNPFVARMISAWGGRLLVTIGALIVALSVAGSGFAQDYWTFLAFRAVGGIGSAMFNVAAMTILLNATPASLRGRASAVYSGSFLIGSMAGPAVGGILAGISLRAPFFFYAVTLLLSAAAAWFLLTKASDLTQTQPTESAPALAIREIVRDPRFLAACGANFVIGWQAFGARTTLVPILITEHLGGTTQQTGLLFAIAAIAQGIFLAPAGWATDRLGRKPVLISALVICAISSWIIPDASNIAWLAVLLSIFAIGGAGLSTAPTALIGDAAHGGRGAPVAIAAMVSDVGTIVGPLVAGALADNFGMPFAFALGAGLMALVAITSWAILPNHSYKT